MSTPNLKKQYRQILEDSFPFDMEIRLGENEALRYEKVTWNIDGEEKGLRYGENPHQPAALYRLVNGNLVLGEVKAIGPEAELTSAARLVKSGKHPGMINITDIDAALNILRYFEEDPVTVIVKHNNPSGVARRENLTESYVEAFMADPIAAFGGVVALNRDVDIETAREICRRYTEVVVAPGYSSGALVEFGKKKNLRIMEIRNIDRLRELTLRPALDFTSLIDGGLVLQWAYRTTIGGVEDFHPAETFYREKEYRVERSPSPEELEDMLFGWQVEAGVTSNSVLYVKNGTTIGIGTGEQDRVGCAQIARDKAYEKSRQRFSLLSFGKGYGELDARQKQKADEHVCTEKGDISGSVMVSDGFFPFRDGLEVGLKEGVTAVVQPGGSLRDFESIEACNEYGAAMLFTGERSFRH